MLPKRHDSLPLRQPLLLIRAGRVACYAIDRADGAAPAAATPRLFRLRFDAFASAAALFFFIRDVADAAMPLSPMAIFAFALAIIAAMMLPMPFSS